MEAFGVGKGEVTKAQLREAERGFTRLLFSKRFPRSWIEENAADLMAQAQVEYAERLKAGREDQTVGLLIVIAYRRAQTLLDVQRRRPPTSSIETVIHLADESAPTPEHKVIERDRRERILKAMSCLPDKECKLLAYVYFDRLSIRAAGRRLGWAKSAADRHHKAALDRLEPMLGERKYLAELPVPAFIAAMSRHGVIHRWLSRLDRAVAELGELWRKLSPLTEPGNAAAVSSVGRAAAVCGAAVVACGLAAATGVVGLGVAGSTSQARNPPAQRRETSAPIPAISKPWTPAADGKGEKSSPTASEPIKPATVEPASQMRSKGERARTVNAPRATVKQTIEEFGVEASSGSTGEASPEPSSEPSPSSVSSAAARPSSPQPSSSGSSSASPPKGGPGSSEFGM